MDIPRQGGDGGKKKRKDKVLKSLDFPLFEIEQPITSKEPRNAVA